MPLTATGVGGGAVATTRSAWAVVAPLALFSLALLVTLPHSRIPTHPGGGGLLSSITREVLDPVPRCGLDTRGHYVFNASIPVWDAEERWRPEATMWRWVVDDDGGGCQYSISDFNDFVAAFVGRTLTFMGDSTMRTTFFHFTCALLRCSDGSDRLGPRDGDGPGAAGWDDERARQCEHCKGDRYVPSAVLRLGPRYGGITLRWYWLSWMDHLLGAPEPGSGAWAEDWRSYVDTIPREFDFESLFNTDTGDFFAVGCGLWELKYPGWPVNTTERVELPTAVTYFTERLRHFVAALEGTHAGSALAEQGRFVFRGLPISELDSPHHAAARARAGDTAPLRWPHYAQTLTLAAQAAQAAVLAGSNLPYFDVSRYTHYALSQAVTGLNATPPSPDEGFQLTMDGTHPRPVVSLLQMRAMLSFFADSALLRR